MKAHTTKYKKLSLKIRYVTLEYQEVIEQHELYKQQFHERLVYLCKKCKTSVFNDNEKKVKKLLGFDMTLTEIAVRFSHLEVWKKSLALNIPILVLEDDFAFEHNIDECIKFALKYYDSWQVLRLQALFDSNFEILKEEKNIKLVKNLSDPLGCTAYFVKPTSAKTLIEHSQNFFEPIDHFLEHSSYHGLNFLAIKPYPVDITGEPPTVYGRDDRKPIRGLKKLNRSINRFIDRLISKKPWFN